MQVPRQMRYASKDDTIIDFRTKLLANKIRHRQYNPKLEGVFSKYLFEGIFDHDVTMDDSI